MNIIHIISGLNRGGAESILYSLVSSPSLCKHTVISMTDEGVYGPKLRDCGVNVHVLGMSRGFIQLRSLYRLYKIIREDRPDVVQTWMCHADFIGGIMAKLAGVKSVVWGIHSTRLDFDIRSLPQKPSARQIIISMSGPLCQDTCPLSNLSIQTKAGVGK